MGNEHATLARLLSSRTVEPDGSLWRGDEVIATFEAKYSTAASGTTFRSHYFQAVTTAAAVDSPLAVLVYPEMSAPVSWDVVGFDGKPARLVAVGLDLYGYQRGRERERGELLLGVVRDAAESHALR